LAISSKNEKFHMKVPGDRIVGLFQWLQTDAQFSNTRIFIDFSSNFHIGKNRKKRSFPAWILSFIYAMH